MACAQRTGSFYCRLSYVRTYKLCSTGSHRVSQVSGSQSLQGLVSLLHYWPKSYLRLLGDFGPSLKDSPQEVHRVDPERGFKSSDFQILESILIMMRNFAESLPSMLLIEHCEKNTSGTELDGYFVVDERPQVFFTLSLDFITAHRIYC